MHPIDLAAFWPGYAIVASHQHVKDTLTLTLEPLTTELPRCGRCLKPSPLIHDRRIRHVRSAICSISMSNCRCLSDAWIA